MVTGEHFRVQHVWFWLQGLSAVWPWAHSLTSLKLSFLIYKMGNIIPASKEDLEDTMVSWTQDAQHSALRRFSENHPWEERNEITCSGKGLGELWWDWGSATKGPGVLRVKQEPAFWSLLFCPLCLKHLLYKWSMLIFESEQKQMS